MGEFGVGSRGAGDFFAHRQIARIIGRPDVAVGVEEMDDAGAVSAGGDYIVVTVDGMHSRLSDFPFLAGFHVTRATLRDVYVMGAKPVALLSDIHVADDGDVARVFDYTAGVTAVGEAMGVPLVTGSTLRIGGGMGPGSRGSRRGGAAGGARPPRPPPPSSAAASDVSKRRVLRMTAAPGCKNAAPPRRSTPAPMASAACWPKTALESCTPSSLTPTKCWPLSREGSTLRSCMPGSRYISSEVSHLPA